MTTTFSSQYILSHSLSLKIKKPSPISKNPSLFFFPSSRPTVCHLRRRWVRSRFFLLGFFLLFSALSPQNLFPKPLTPLVPIKAKGGTLAVHGGSNLSSVSGSSLFNHTGVRLALSCLRSRVAPHIFSATVVSARLPALSPRRGFLLAWRRTAVATSFGRSVIAFLSSDSIPGGGPSLHSYLNQGLFSLIDGSCGSWGLEWMVLFGRWKSGCGLGFDGSFPASLVCAFFSLQSMYLYVVADLTLPSYDDNWVLGVGFLWLSVITLNGDYWLFVAVFSLWSYVSLIVGCLPLDTDFSASYGGQLHWTQFSLSKFRSRRRNGSLSSTRVVLPDFFLADQLTSQVQAFRNVEFYICYYGWGDFKKRSNSCHASDVYKTFYYIVGIVPFWIRCLQSIRRFIDEKDSMQVLNAMKYRYFLTCVSVALNTTYDLNKGTTIRICAIVTSVIAVVVNTYWDIVFDWGLLRKDSKNKWLRDKLAVPHKSVYYVAIVMNGVLRLFWMQSVVGFTALPILHNKVLVAIGSSMEIIRRGMWNFFRLENEHLNNVGHFRASKSVPLPFNHDDEDN